MSILTYFFWTVVLLGPVLENVSTTANTLTLSFSNQSVGGGMALHDVVGLNVDGTWNNCTLCCKELPPFEVHTSKDGWTQVAQNATTVTDTAVLLSPAVSVSSVTAVRYAWTDFVECVLQNDDGLVAGPFVVEVNDKHSQDSDTIAAPRGAGDLSLSPPMGFNSWNFYHCNSALSWVELFFFVLGGVGGGGGDFRLSLLCLYHLTLIFVFIFAVDENIVKSIADAMATNGMKAAGYSYINIDDCKSLFGVCALHSTLFLVAPAVACFIVAAEIIVSGLRCCDARLAGRAFPGRNDPTGSLSISFWNEGTGRLCPQQGP